MHVIVGQGQLDSILHATPEDRRGFIEEAAGVLKHRKRKEKALRKLDACDGNLTRLTDLLGEIRRQLKPLGRQAEVARRAAGVQSAVRDAKARLIADDLVTARAALEQELADESVLVARREEVEAQPGRGHPARERASRPRCARTCPRWRRAQETWFALSGLRERLRGTQSLAAERVRNAEGLGTGDVATGRDPEALEAEAAQVREQESAIEAEVEAHRVTLEQAVSARRTAEDAVAEEERRVAGLHRAAADRREGLARLVGQVNALRSRAAAADDEIGRLTQAHEDALSRAARAQHDFTALETRVAGLDAGEEGLDAEHEAAAAQLDDLEERLAKVREEAQRAERDRATLAARKDALELGLNRKDGAGALLAASDQVSGLLGSVAALLTVRGGFETAVASALGSAADAVASRTPTPRSPRSATSRSTTSAGPGWCSAPGPRPRRERLARAARGRVYALDVVTCPDAVRPALARLLDRVAVVDDLAAARALLARDASLTAVTRDGDLLGAHLAAGGSASQPSLIEIQAAVDEAAQQLAEAIAATERLGFDMSRLERERHEAQKRVDVALAKLHESDATLAAVAEELRPVRCPGARRPR